MARAKRTDRAEARRRYRAEQGIIEGEGDDAPVTAAPRKSTPAPAAPPAAPRIGLRAAFSQAFRPLDVRGDLQSIPTVLIRSKALWIPIGVTLAAFALVVSVGMKDTGILNVVATLLYQYFLFTPAIGGAFLAGFLAPRASWLLGAFVGLVAASCFAILVLVIPEQVFPTVPDAAAARELVIAAFTLSPLMGALFASAAAWYRRFLYLSNPNRGRSRTAPPKGSDGKSRTSGQTKANTGR